MTDEIVDMNVFKDDLSTLKEHLAPVLEEQLRGIDFKSSTIFFSSIIKEMLKDIDEPDFKQLIIRFIMD